MGMYTELVLKVQIKEDIPNEISNVLNYLFNNEILDNISPPKHPFFETPRWTMVGRCSSYYHIPWSCSQYEKNYIFSRSDFKDYSNEIELFLDWLNPYIDGTQGECIGWTWYETKRTPTLRFKK